MPILAAAMLKFGCAAPANPPKPQPNLLSMEWQVPKPPTVKDIAQRTAECLRGVEEDDLQMTSEKVVMEIRDETTMTIVFSERPNEIQVALRYRGRFFHLADDDADGRLDSYGIRDVDPGSRQTTYIKSVQCEGHTGCDEWQRTYTTQVLPQANERICELRRRGRTFPFKF